MLPSQEGKDSGQVYRIWSKVFRILPRLRERWRGAPDGGVSWQCSASICDQRAIPTGPAPLPLPSAFGRHPPGSRLFDSHISRLRSARSNSDRVRRLDLSSPLWGGVRGGGVPDMVRPTPTTPIPYPRHFQRKCRHHKGEGRHQRCGYSKWPVPRASSKMCAHDSRSLGGSPALYFARTFAPLACLPGKPPGRRAFRPSRGP